MTLLYCERLYLWETWRHHDLVDPNNIVVFYFRFGGLSRSKVMLFQYRIFIFTDLLRKQIDMAGVL